MSLKASKTSSKFNAEPSASGSVLPQIPISAILLVQI